MGRDNPFPWSTGCGSIVTAQEAADLCCQGSHSAHCPPGPSEPFLQSIRHSLCCFQCFFLPNPLHCDSLGISDSKGTTVFVRAVFCSSPYWLLDLYITIFLMLCHGVAVGRVVPSASPSHLHHLLWCVHTEFPTCTYVAGKTVKYTLMMELCPGLWLWLRLCCC